MGHTISRRRFIRAGASAGGGLLLSANLRGLLPSASGASPAPTTAPAPLDQKIAELAMGEGVSFLGAADMTGAWGTLRALAVKAPPAELAALPRAVALGLRLSDELIDPLPRQMPDFTRHFYAGVWPKAKLVARKIGGFLRQQGFKAAYGAAGLEGVPKMAARLAGLGWIGKSCLLVAPEAGPRVAWEVVLTDAPLTPAAGKPDERHCGDCQRCVDVCPAKALTTAPFKETDPLSVRFSSAKCQEYRQSLGNLFTESACALCMMVCPFGRQQNVLWSPETLLPATRPAAGPADAAAGPG